MTFMNMCVPNIKASSYTRQKPIGLQRDIDELASLETSIYHLLETERSSRQKSSKDVFELNSTISHLSITDI